MDKPLAMENIDTASGVLFPFWDDGTNMVYLVGKVSLLSSIIMIIILVYIIHREIHRLDILKC